MNDKPTNTTPFRFGGQNHELSPDAVLDLLEELHEQSAMRRQLTSVVHVRLQEGRYTRPYARIFDRILAAEVEQ